MINPVSPRDFLCEPQRVILANQTTGSKESENADDNHVIVKSAERNSNDPDDDDDDDEQNENNCAICLGNYEDGEEISISHNRLCAHHFHKRCISEWLLTHEECPCCRNNYLTFNDDEQAEEGGGPVEQALSVRQQARTDDPNNDTSNAGDSALAPRGLRIFYQFTGRPPLAAAATSTRPNATPNEVELPATAVAPRASPDENSGSETEAAVERQQQHPE